MRDEYGGVTISLARQEWPDTSGFTDPEVVHRLDMKHHIGFVLAATLGLVLALARIAFPSTALPISVLVELIRSTPLLIQIFGRSRSDHLIHRLALLGHGCQAFVDGM